jgi:hypothetical protein
MKSGDEEKRDFLETFLEDDHTHTIFSRKKLIDNQGRSERRKP